MAAQADDKIEETGIDYDRNNNHSLPENSKTDSRSSSGEPTLGNYASRSSDPSAAHHFQENHHTSKLSTDSLDVDLELEVLQQDDPLHSNGSVSLRNRNSLGAPKSEDWVGATEAPGDMDYAAKEKEARRLGNKQFIQKTVINCILIGLWCLSSPVACRRYPSLR